MSGRNVAAAVRARLLSLARARKMDFNSVLTRYAIERLLYRIGISRYADRFLLKGALLFDVWFDFPNRPTRDADFLGFGSAELPHIESVFKEICGIDASDGVVFQSEGIHAAEIRIDASYAGVRVMALGLIDGARCRIQIDVGFGDAVTPGPENVEYPVMLPEFPAPRLRAYPRYTVVAEKLEALTSLGIANSRMKDYFDLWVLVCHSNFKGDILRNAVQATFAHRKSTLAEQVPLGLTDKFAQDRQKQTQWRAFLKKNRLEALELGEVITVLADFLAPVIEAAATNAAFPADWRPGGPWLSVDGD